jgi:hypothetical protein
LVKNLRRDVYFFKTRGLLDYSLLLAVEELDDKTFDAVQRKGFCYVTSGQRIKE